MKLLIIVILCTFSCVAEGKNKVLTDKVFELFAKIHNNEKLSDFFVDDKLKKRFLKDLGEYYAKLPYRGYMVCNDIDKETYEVYMAFRQGVKFRVKYKNKKITVITSFVVAKLSEINEERKKKQEK